MKRAIAAAALVALTLAAPAKASTPECYEHGEHFPFEMACHHSFVATTEPTRLVALDDHWKWYAIAWTVGEHVVPTGIRPCRMYGRYGDLRVHENTCDGRLVLSVRSIGEPIAVTVKWEGWR